MGSFKSVVFACGGCLAALAFPVEGAVAGDSSVGWQGFYAGVHAGYADGSAGWSFPDDEFFDDPATGASFSHDPNGWLGGGHVGYNFQTGSLVLGFEGSYDFGDVSKDDSKSPFFSEDRFSTDIDNLGMFGGRLGFAWQSFLLYGKGGFATAEVDVDFNATLTGVRASSSERQKGHFAGVGVETLISRNLVLGIEYVHVELDSERHQAELSGVAAGVQTVDADAEFDVFSLRASYRFD